MQNNGGQMADETTATKRSLKLDRLVQHKTPTGVLGFDFGFSQEALFLACVDGVYDMNSTSGEANLLYSHGSYASSVVTLADQKTIVSAGYDGRIKWYDSQAKQIPQEIHAHEFWSWEMAVSPDRSLIASATGQYIAGDYDYRPAPETEPSVRIYDATTGAERWSLSHVPSVQSITFSPDGSLVAAANLMGEIRIWNVADGKLIANWTTNDFTSWGIIKSHCYLGGIFALAFSPDGDHLLAAGMGPMRDPMAGNGKQLWQRFAWREEPVRKVDEIRSGQHGEGLMETLAVSESNRMFVMGGRLRGGDWNAAVFDLDSGEKLGHLNTGFRMTHAKFNTKGDRLYIAGCNGQGKPKDGVYGPWGRVEVYKVDFPETAVESDEAPTG